MKTCLTCSIPKPPSFFSKDLSRPDNKQNSCKSCAKNYRDSIAIRMTKYRRDNAGKNNAYQSYYRRTEVGKHNLEISKIKSDAKYPLAKECREQTRYLIKKGALMRPDLCENCSDTCKPDAHHCDYKKPRDIQWLCLPCHVSWHKNNTPLNREA